MGGHRLGSRNLAAERTCTITRPRTGSALGHESLACADLREALRGHCRSGAIRTRSRDDSPGVPEMPRPAIYLTKTEWRQTTIAPWAASCPRPCDWSQECSSSSPTNRRGDERESFTVARRIMVILRSYRSLSTNSQDRAVETPTSDQPGTCQDISSSIAQRSNPLFRPGHWARVPVITSQGSRAALRSRPDVRDHFPERDAFER
jgi:hypothetical protein